MGRLSEFFNQHRDNVEDAVERALDKADKTIDSLAKRVEELEQKLRDVAGEAPAKNENKTAEANQDGVVTSDRTNNPVETSVAAEADKTARKSKK
jgi:hypothetical protein